jgi:predicted small lipoprotein YifL
MPRLVFAAVLALAALAACESKGKPAAPPAEDPLRADLDRICHAMTLSGADQEQAANATYVMATWLDANIASEAGRTFLVEFAQLGQDRAARVAKLEGAALRAGLPACPLIEQWR